MSIQQQYRFDWLDPDHLAPAELKAALNELIDAKARNLVWHEVARLAEKAFAAASSKFDSAWVSDALTQATGLSARILVRQRKILNFLVQAAPLIGRTYEGVLSPAFAALEYVQMIYSRDRDAGLRELVDLLDHGLGVAYFKRRWEERHKSPPQGLGPTADHSVTALQRQERYKLARDHLKFELNLSGRISETPTLGGIYDRVGPSIVKYDFASPVLDDERSWVGFEVFYAPSRMPLSQFDQALAQWLFSASFFDTYFLLLTEESPYLDRVKTTLDILKVENIEIRKVETVAIGYSKYHRKGGPNPDYRKIFRTVEKMLVDSSRASSPKKR